MTPASQVCRLCSAKSLRLFLDLAHSAGNISRMLLEREIGMIAAVDLRVFECTRCGFVQLTESLGGAFYDDYLMTTSHSQQMQDFQHRQIADFVERYGLRGRRVVEAGCGDGAYMMRLAEAGAIVSGIEPSRRFRELALSRNLRVFAGYVQAESPIPEGPYDAFVTRQVLEHVPDPHDFLLGIRNSLSDHAVGLVEVPSLEQAIEHRRFYDFFPDHLNYFSQRTLRLALEMNGFAVEQIDRGMNGEYNVAHVRVAASAGQSRLQEHTHRLVAELRDFLSAERQAGRRVAVWGSGGKGVSVMSIARATDLAYVVDTDPHKHGRYTPVTHFPIVSPESLRHDPVDTVLVTALAYRDEILQELTESYGFRGKIAVLGPRIETVRADTACTPREAGTAMARDAVPGKDLAQRIRSRALRLVHEANASHIGSCLSMADVLAVLYGRVLRVDPAAPGWDQRDRFILSKGHAAAILYATLAERGFFSPDELAEYCRPGSRLTGHVSHHVPGVELSTGSLGHGLSVGCGMALAGKRENCDYRVFVLLSDGELDEGSNWEPILFAAHHGLDNLVAIVDYNKMQGFGEVEKVLSLDSLADKWKAFGWAVTEVDGHDHDALGEAFLRLPFAPGRPSVVVANTIKGKGVKFMEDSLAWHYKSPDSQQLQQALKELRYAA